MINLEWVFFKEILDQISEDCEWLTLNGGYWLRIANGLFEAECFLTDIGEIGDFEINYKV